MFYKRGYNLVTSFNSHKKYAHGYVKGNKKSNPEIIYISSKPVCLFLLNIREDIVNTINFNVDQRFWIRSLKYLFTEELKSNRFGRHTASNL